MASYPPPPPPGYGPPPPGYGPPPGQYYGPTRSTHGKAIAALVCSIASFVVCQPFTAIAAVILAPQAKREILAEPDRYEGEGLAKAGQIIGWIALGLWIAGIVGFVAVVVIAALADSTSSYDSLGLLVS